MDETAGKELIYHSDRGWHMPVKNTSLLKEQGITISMTVNGNLKDNAQAERINHTMKNEFLRVRCFMISRRLKRLWRKLYFSIISQTPYEYQYDDTSGGCHSCM